MTTRRRVKVIAGEDLRPFVTSRCPARYNGVSFTRAFRGIYIMFAKELTRFAHTRRFTDVENGRNGWELTVLDDNQVVRHAIYSDWHRVEHALMTIEEEIAALQDEGWKESALV
jgi:hypothetical protein